MFKFIKNLFNEKKTKTNSMEINEMVLPKVNDHELDNIMREVDEVAAAFEEKLADHHQVLTDTVKRLGIVHKFRDVTTGEIYEVGADDFEGFDKMMCNKNMQMVFG